jgi:peptidoglycan/xylan/chitin deacetylase (PgdA/CDA1 family)
MYLDISVRKVFFIVVLVGLLLMCVFVTNYQKEQYFGSTPFFYTIITSSKYFFNSIIADLEKSTLFAQSFFSRSSSTLGEERGIPVLTYHRIVGDPNDTSNVPLATFRDQMQTLKNAGWQAVSLADFEAYVKGEKPLPDRSFLITFDDGAKESFYPADPVLQAFGYNAALYVIGASSQTPESTYYLSPQEIQWILKTGRWSIGSHSYDGHRPYPADAQGDAGVFFADRLWIPSQNRLETPAEFQARVEDDLTHAKTYLQNTYKIPIDTFAFPLGNETNITGTANFPAGASTTESVARSIYAFGFLQTNNQEFTYNFPITTSPATDIASETRNMLATDFTVRRIHVDHDWNGARLLSILENGREKSLPYQDDFSQDNGWILSWGKTDLGRNNFTLSAVADQTSVSTMLDGSELWDNYGFDMTGNWQSGFLSAEADVVNSKTYDACVFSQGKVEIQSVTNGTTQTLTSVQNPSIQFSSTAHPGIRVRGSTIECSWNYTAIADAFSRVHSGGIGMQIWNENSGTAQLQVSSIIVRPLTASTTPAQ